MCVVFFLSFIRSERQSVVADPGFPKRGGTGVAKPRVGCANLLFGMIKMHEDEKNRLIGGGERPSRPLASPLVGLLYRSDPVKSNSVH